MNWLYPFTWCWMEHEIHSMTIFQLCISCYFSDTKCQKWLLSKNRVSMVSRPIFSTSRMLQLRWECQAFQLWSSCPPNSEPTWSKPLSSKETIHMLLCSNTWIGKYSRQVLPYLLFLVSAIIVYISIGHFEILFVSNSSRFIEKYVLCKGCNYPELRMTVEGKDLKSRCNSCGKGNSHDSLHKAGKALVNYLKQGGGQQVDIQKRDNV